MVGDKETTVEKFDMEKLDMELQGPAIVPSIQDEPNPNLDEIQHVEMVQHDVRTGREEFNDGLHLVTTHFLLSSETSRRQK